MTINAKYNLRCPVCLAEYSFKTLANSGVKQCPNADCRTILQPLEARFDGYIRVNWQDMRTLAIYAIRWAKIFDMTQKGDRDAKHALDNIVEGLRRFQPVGAQEIVPKNDPVTENMRRLEVKKLGEIGKGDNMGTKPDAKGNIPSPFFKRF